jgi:ABC-type Fe3+-siderophore transport system permease subunit
MNNKSLGWAAAATSSLIGVPFFIWMVLRTRRSYW